ncbi:hypothetical protein ACUOFC_63715, partial [Escherichia sp. TWPC-MK]
KLGISDSTYSGYETTDKEKAGNSPACPDLYSLIFRLTIYIAQKLSNLTVCFERKAEVHH